MGEGKLYLSTDKGVTFKYFGELAGEEWQPARLRTAHDDPAGVVDAKLFKKRDAEAVESDLRKIHMYRPIEPTQPYIDYFRALGCDAQNFFEIQATAERGAIIVCEHEILTD